MHISCVQQSLTFCMLCVVFHVRYPAHIGYFFRFLFTNNFHRCSNLDMINLYKTSLQIYCVRISIVAFLFCVSLFFFLFMFIFHADVFFPYISFFTRTRKPTVVLYLCSPPFIIYRLILRFWMDSKYSCSLTNTHIIYFMYADILRMMWRDANL